DKTYFQWMENIQPWCVSRQLWWGHQIPAWYGPKKKKTGTSSPGLFGEVGVGSRKLELRGAPSSLLSSASDDFEGFVAESETAALELASEYYGPEIPVRILREDERGSAVGFDERRGLFVNIFRDPDVLDTWFSSALWPFSTLGWPEKTPEVKRYYPT